MKTGRVTPGHSRTNSKGTIVITTINGLDFKVISPSCFKLVNVRDDIGDPSAFVVIAYNGFKWWLHYESSRTKVHRMFPSRDAAIALIASRVAS